MTISLPQLLACMPQCPTTRASAMLAPMNAAMDKAGINTRLRMSAFVASIGHESMDLIFMKEIASGEAYENRLDLGNTHAGDGRRFKGRGPIQITGRDNYTKFAAWSGLDCVNHPELLEDPAAGFLASAWFWMSKGLNELADEDNFLRVSTRINGKRADGYPNHWEDRRKRYELAKKVFV